MYLFRAKPIFFLLLILSFQSIATDTYEVKKGDTLSEIVLKNTQPPPNLYGLGGRLSNTIILNPQILNPNLIKEGSLIKLEKYQSKEKKDIFHGSTSNKKLYDYFEVGLGLGARYYSHSQSRVLGKADTGTIFIDNIHLLAAYITEKYSYTLNLDTYKFNYKTNKNKSSKRLYLFTFKASYSDILFGINLEQYPLFRNDGLTIDIVAETLNLLFVGYKWDFNLSRKIETKLEVQASINYLMTSKSDETKVDIDSSSGYGVNINSTLSRFLLKLNQTPVFYFWNNDISFRDIKRNISWDNSVGEVHSKHINLKTTVGLKLRF